MPDQMKADVSANHAVRRLRAMIDRLAGIDQLTEQAFLQVGEQVRDGQSRALFLTGLAEQALCSGESESAEQTVARLQLLTERSAMWLTEACEQSRLICTLLESLERNTNALAPPLQGLAKVVKTLHALRVATRIEAARGHGQGGTVLGQELQQLGNQMQEKLGHINERCEVLATLRIRAVSIEEQAQAGPLREAEGEIRRARLLLSQVATHCVRTSDHAVRFRQSSAELAGNFGELVAALQFQDITRQRLQHICKALDDLSAGLDAGGEAALSAGGICQLQHDQLIWAVEEFGEAVGRLDQNLRGMSEGVRSLAGDAREALIAGSSERCAQIAPSLQAVTACLENVRTTHLAAGQAVFAVCQAVRDVASLAGEIERLGEEMQLLAQNAAVSAAHGSAKAAGLTVIAGNIQTIAEDAGRYAAAMADGCRLVSSQAEELDARDQELSSSETDLQKLLEEVGGLLGRLESVSASFDAQIAEIGRQVDELGAGMQTTLASLDVRRRFLAQTNPVLDELKALALEYGVSGHDGKDGGLLLGLHDRYTMMSEREVHQRFLRQSPSAGGGGIPSTVLEEDLGSNVELF
ncbi:MAG: hypothetical protein FDZ69_02495 [Deltaproteobacteria bacterium]|nr:MAG: hypothetical protein FDZ69_02495 [Deltaproteobacteria bacterium]